jgi:pyridinium-3,5-bisthiocarboxylic acid mononucleotide nickel chelatase
MSDLDPNANNRGNKNNNSLLPELHLTATPVLSSVSSWQRPEVPQHAHFDCFSGAAGDMMLAACIDAAGSPHEGNALLQYVVQALSLGIPALSEEFQVTGERVWRGSGSIAATKISVHSIYQHAAAPVPAPDKVNASENSVKTQVFDSHEHAHDHSIEQSHKHAHYHDHSSTNEKLETTKVTTSNSSHNHAHEHAHSHEHIPNDMEHSHEHNHAHTVTDKSESLVESTVPNSSSHSHEHEHENNPSLAIHHNHNHHHYAAAASHAHGPLRNLPQIRTLLKAAPEKYIPAWVRTQAIAVFTALAHAEAAVHGASSMDAVHFHEVGAVDSLVDTIGTLLALDALHVTTVSCSRLPWGEGTVQTEHGCLPVPAPATVHLMKDVLPLTAGPPGRTGELVTPTAAALLRVLTTTAAAPGVRRSGRPPDMVVRQVGTGAGSKNFEQHPNIMRVLIGTLEP